MDHYKSIGFDQVLFYDNNENNAQFELLQKYINEGFVKYHDKKNLSGKLLQKQIYFECFNSYKKDFD